MKYFGTMSDPYDLVNKSYVDHNKYAVCSTAGNVAAKTVSIPYFLMQTGVTIRVKFLHANTTENPTLNVSNTLALPIKSYGTLPPINGGWKDNEIVSLLYDGSASAWIIVGVTHTIVDQSLSILGAAADAKTVGELIAGITDGAVIINADDSAQSNWESIYATIDWTGANPRPMKIIVAHKGAQFYMLTSYNEAEEERSIWDEDAQEYIDYYLITKSFRFSSVNPDATQYITNQPNIGCNSIIFAQQLNDYTGVYSYYKTEGTIFLSEPVKPGTITLYQNRWTGTDPYMQTASVIGVTTTQYSKVDLEPTITQLAQLTEDGVTALVVENDNGGIKVHALGGTPTTDIELQCTVVEVLI